MSKPDVWDLAINLIGLVSVLAVSVPALYANRYGRLLYKLAKLDSRSAALKIARAGLEADLQKQRDRWSWKNSVLLLGGTILAGLSYGLGVAKTLIHPT